MLGSKMRRLIAFERGERMPVGCPGSGFDTDWVSYNLSNPKPGHPTEAEFNRSKSK